MTEYKFKLITELVIQNASYWPYFAVGVSGIVCLKFISDVKKKKSALQGAAWELTRLMENTTPDAVIERARIAEATIEKFAVVGNASVNRSTLINDDPITPNLTDAGIKLMEKRAKEDREFKSYRSELRQGIGIFLQLVVYKNYRAAFIGMKEYKIRQRTKDMPRLTQLGILLERYGWWNRIILRSIVSQRVMRGLEYHPQTPEGETPIVIRNENILVAMRTYLRTSNTYDRSLVD